VIDEKENWYLYQEGWFDHTLEQNGFVTTEDVEKAKIERETKPDDINHWL